MERDIGSSIYWNRAGKGFSATDRARLFTHSASGCIAADIDAKHVTLLPTEGPHGISSVGLGNIKHRQASRKERQRRWVQYRLALGSTSGLSTPRVTRVDVHYESS